MQLQQIAFWDEKHMKIILGCCSKHEWRIPLGPDGNYLSEAEGGVYPEEMPVTSQKFAQECRGCFGVGMKWIDGVLVGHAFEPFDYTGLFVLGEKEYVARTDAEVKRVELLGGPWKAKWPDNHDWKNMEGGK